MTQEDEELSQHFKTIMQNMVELINLFEIHQDFQNVDKHVGHTTLSLGFFQDKLVTGCNIDWLVKKKLYQISFSDMDFVVPLEKVIDTIQQHLNYQRDTDSFEFQGLRNWSWERCRHRFLLANTSYVSSLANYIQEYPDEFVKSMQQAKIRKDNMVRIIDLLEEDSQLTNMKKRVGHNALFMGKDNIHWSLEWIDESQKFAIKFNHEKETKLFTQISPEKVIPTIKQYISTVE